MPTKFNNLLAKLLKNVSGILRSKFDFLHSEDFQKVFIFVLLFTASILVASVFNPNLAIAKDPVPLSIAISSEPGSLDPHQKRVISDQIIAGQIFDELVTADNKWRLLPAIVESWSNPDDLTWIFKLRKNIRFHNGDPLTTRDVIFSIDRIRTKYKEYSGTFTTVESYDMIDEYTFRLKTSKPDGLLLTKLTRIYIVPEKYLKEVGDVEFAKRPVGSGPYKYVSGDVKKLQLALNQHYWKIPMGIKDVIIQYIPQAQQYKALLDGSVDIVSDISSDEFEQLEKNPQFQALGIDSRMFYYLGMDVKREQTPQVQSTQNPFRNPRVRLAIAKTIDIDAINNAVFKGRAVPASQIASSLVFGFNPEIKIEERNIEKARQLMNDAGYGDGFTVVLNTPSGSREQIAHILAKQLSDINIKINVESIEPKNFWKIIFKENHDFSFFLAGWAVDRSVERTLSQLFASKTLESEGKINFTMYSNPKVDDLIHLANGEIDEDRQKQYFQEAWAIIMTDKPVIPLFSIPIYFGLSKRIDWQPPADPAFQIKYIKFIEHEKSFFDSVKGYF